MTISILLSRSPSSMKRLVSLTAKLLPIFTNAALTSFLKQSTRRSDSNCEKVRQTSLTSKSSLLCSAYEPAKTRTGPNQIDYVISCSNKVLWCETQLEVLFGNISKL